MNAVQIIESVKAHHAELVIQDGDLVVRGRGEPLPEQLQAALRLHKAELLVALGSSREVAVVEVLDEIRPHLPPALRGLPDSSLLALVNWSLLHAWNSAARGLRSGRREDGPSVAARDVAEQGAFFEGEP